MPLAHPSTVLRDDVVAPAERLMNAVEHRLDVDRVNDDIAEIIAEPSVTFKELVGPRPRPAGNVKAVEVEAGLLRNDSPAPDRRVALGSERRRAGEGKASLGPAD